MVDLKKPWYITITNDNYDLLSEWWGSKPSPKSNLYKKGVCGYYSLCNNINRISKGHCDKPCDPGHFTFGREITLDEFKRYIYNNIKIYEIW